MYFHSFELSSGLGRRNGGRSLGRAPLLKTGRRGEEEGKVGND